MELEQLSHRPQGGVVDLLEIERRVELGRDALQHQELGRLAGEIRSHARAFRVALDHQDTARSAYGSFSTERTP